MELGEPFVFYSLVNYFWSRQKVSKESEILKPEENEFNSFGQD